MSTQIKKNGNWVTVAGGTRMWVGTKAALQAALDAGELVDGTAVMVTDDYEEAYRPHPDWANAVAITAAQLTAGYTAPSDGMLVGFFLASVDGNLLLSVNGVPVSVARGFSPAASDGNIQVQVNKGDIIQTSSSVGSFSQIHFVPWKD